MVYILYMVYYMDYTLHMVYNIVYYRLYTLYMVYYIVYTLKHIDLFFCSMLDAKNLFYIHIIWTQRGVYIIFEYKINFEREAFLFSMHGILHAIYLINGKLHVVYLIHGILHDVHLIHGILHGIQCIP